jgi:hypothetical protein
MRGLPSQGEVVLGLLAESGKFLFDLVVDFDIFVFVGPFGELLVVELLFEFGLEIGDFLFLGSPLVNELLGSGSGSG